MKGVFGFLFLSILFVVLAEAKNVSAQAVKVAIKRTNGQYLLMRDGKPYYVNGVGGSKLNRQAAEAGANSVRTWGSNDLESILASAQSNGLTVAAGLWVMHERHGFDYNDAGAVKAQLERFREVVLKYKDHPNLLCWGIGNEVHIEAKNTKVWEAINEISKMIHKLDPNHPTMTVTADFSEQTAVHIRKLAPDLDFVGINSYGGLDSLSMRLKKLGWEKPFMVTEWGPNGIWESQKTPWGAGIEETSGEKAKTYERRFNLIKGMSNCMGSYVFQWGWKQEKTATWYGLFIDPGLKTEVADVMVKAWSGSYPKNRSPHVTDILLNQRKAHENVTVKPGSKNIMRVSASDPEQDVLKFRWVLMEESVSKKTGGDKEDVPPEIPGVFGSGKAVMKFKAPKKSGNYRAFVYVNEDNNNCSYANFPFRVE